MISMCQWAQACLRSKNTNKSSRRCMDLSTKLDRWDKFSPFCLKIRCNRLNSQNRQCLTLSRSVWTIHRPKRWCPNKLTKLNNTLSPALYPTSQLLFNLRATRVILINMDRVSSDCNLSRKMIKIWIPSPTINLARILSTKISKTFKKLAKFLSLQEVPPMGPCTVCQTNRPNSHTIQIKQSLLR